MLIKDIKLHNFFSFGEDVPVQFPGNSPVLVEGKTSSELNSNGAGKTALFEAFYWCLTGKTVRGVRAAAVVRAGMGECRVWVAFVHNGKQYEVLRVWSKKEKSLTFSVDGKGQEFHDARQGTARLFEDLGMSPETLAFCCFCGRKYQTFSELTPRGRADLIDWMTRGDQWRSAEQVATKEIRTAQTKIDMQEQKSRDLDKEIDRLRAEIAAYAERLAFLANQTEERIRELEGQVEPMKKSLADFQASQPVLDAEEERLKQESGTGPALQESDRLVELKDEKRELDGYISQWRVRAQEIEKRIEELRDQTKTGKCYACGQEIDQEKKAQGREEEASLKRSVQEMVADAHRSEERLEKVVRMIREEEQKASEAFDAHKKKMEKYIGAKDIAAQARAAALVLERKIDGVTSSLESLRNSPEIVKLEDRVEGMSQRLKRAKSEREAVQKQIGDLDRDREVAQFWKRGFKEIRFSRFGGALQALSDRVSFYCDQQQLEFKKIEISPFGETAKSQAVPEIQIVLHRGNYALDLGSLSEGETQRVDIAFFLGLSSLIAESTGTEMEFCVFDEPLSGLDASGKENVFAVLCELSKSRQVFVVDHDAHFANLFQSRILVKKTDGVSDVEVL